MRRGQQVVQETVPDAPPTSPQSIVIFLESGRTFTFHDIEIKVDNENILVFRYTAMSDGNMKIASFSKFRIVGHSVYRRINF